MHHVQLMRAATPILKTNPDGGVYLMTLSVAVGWCPCVDSIILTPARV